MDLTQIVGYLGSLVLVVSFMLKNITHIRIVNLIMYLIRSLWCNARYTLANHHP